MHPAVIFEPRREKTRKLYLRTTIGANQSVHSQSDQRFCCSLLGKYNYLSCCMPKFVVFETEQVSFCLT